jgi:HEAT repeat protein
MRLEGAEQRAPPHLQDNQDVTIGEEGAMDDKQNILSKLGPASSFQPGLEDLLAMSTHANGFKRENAVRRLGMLGNPVAIPYLVERANDWVPQVRAAARVALNKLLRPDNAEAFVACLPVIMRLKSRARDDHTELLLSVQEFLLHEENVERLVAGVQSKDVHVARIAIRLLVQRQRMPAAQLVAVGLAHKDVVVRSTVIDLLRTLEATDFTLAVATAMQDPYMPVRREAFQQLLARDVEAGLRAARDLLFDASAAVREIAVHQLLATGAPVEQMYESAFADRSDRVAVVTCVLWSWAFLHNQACSERVLRLLNARFPAVRRAAVQTIAKLLRDDAKPYLEAALGDASPAVAKEAARLLCRIDDKVDIERLLSISKASGLRHVAVACCRVARHAGKWEWLKFILRVYGAADAAVSREVFSAEIDAWEAAFNRSSAQPDEGCVREVVSALRVSEGKLTKEQLQLLRFTLRSYGAPG